MGEDVLPEAPHRRRKVGWSGLGLARRGAAPGTGPAVPAASACNPGFFKKRGDGAPGWLSP